MPQPLKTAVPQELRVAKDSKPPRQSANVELVFELTPRLADLLVSANVRSANSSH
jgi:hypothetical protein